MAFFYRNSWTAYRNRLLRPGHAPIRYRLRPGVDLCADSGAHDVRQINEIWIDEAYSLEDGFTPQPGWLVCDIGANKGFYSAWAAHLMGRGRILAVEPDPRSAEFMRANISQFPEVTVEIITAAIWPSRKKIGLYRREGATGLTSYYGAKTPEGKREPVGSKLSATSVTFDDFLQDRRPDLVKIDVEGAEYRILMTANIDTLSSIPRIVLEYDLQHPRDSSVTFRDLEELLVRAGFAVTYAPDRRLMFARS